MTFDVAVIGLGLIGSAALRHLAASGASVIGIGPAEPAEWASHRGPFASHYDSGRITRRIDARREWAILATRAIEQYAAVEDESGLTFHAPSGHLFVRNDPEGITAQLAVADELDIPIAVAPTEQRAPELRVLRFPDGWTSIYEGPPAGHIDPRVMVEAQLRAAAGHGAEVRREAATAIERTGADRVVGTAGGASVVARQVLMATGPYPSDLLDEPLAVSVRPEAVVLAEVDETGAASLGDMPTVIYLLDDPVLDDTYFVPPVRYPDGHLYLKIGGSSRGARTLDTSEEKRAWMASTAGDHLASLRSAVEAVLPTIAFRSWHAKPCLISDTPSGLPYVDRIDDGLFVALGGNGHAAKSADAIGALAARLVQADGAWSDPDLDRASFAAGFGRFVPGPGSRHGTLHS